MLSERRGLKMNFIKKIFSDNIDKDVHKQFVRFSKGRFANRAIARIKKGKKIAIRTTFEYVNDVVKLIIDNCEGNVNVSGSIVGKDLSKELNLEAEHTKRMGVRKAELKPVSLSKSELINLYEKYKDIFLLLNLDCNTCSLKCKQNLPKPGSGKQSEDEAEMKKVDFCKAVFEKDLSEEFIWEKKDFKEAEASHIFVIDELVVPKELENDYARARIEAKRKGKIIRELNIDGEKKVIEKDISV